MLCRLCAGIFQGDVELGVTYNHHASARDVRHYAKNRCHMCTVLEKHLCKRYGASWDTQLFCLKYKLTPHELEPVPGVPTTLWFTCPSIDAREDGWGIWIQLGELKGADLDDFLLSKKHMQTNTASSVDLALNWLDNCIANHPECMVSNPEQWVPSRLIDVQASPPCLRNRSQVHPGAAYATLSHRWRSPPCLILTTACLADFERALPMESLSTVFLDAINFTKRCGIQFLWIDSLCILQDSKEDWAQESALMGEVYKHGRCNFAATADAEGGDGFFIDRQPSSFRPGCVHTRWAHLRNGCYLWALEEQMWYPPSMAENTFQGRGWILQEGYLSPRTIHFTDTQLHWECRLGFGTETWPCHIPDLIVATSMTRQSYSFKSQVNQNGSNPEILWRWMVLVNRYTGCLLTRESDRLIAFSAIAREFAAILNDTYVAGLWKQNLVSQLDWAVPRLDRKQTCSDAFTAPSWSWAAVGTLAQFSYRFEPKRGLEETEELIKVVEASVTPAFDAYGAVKDGRLVVRGILRSLERIEVIDVAGGPAWFQIRRSPNLLAAPEPIAADVANLVPEFVSMIEYDMLEPPPADQVIYLPTLAVKQPGESRIVGIALKSVAGQVNVFKRVGRFDFLVEFWDRQSSGSEDEDDEEDEDDTDDDQMSEGLEHEDPTHNLHLFWEWDMLSRAFLGNDRPLFEINPKTHEYSLMDLDRLPEITII